MVVRSPTTSLLLRDVEGGASLIVEKDARESRVRVDPGRPSAT